MENEKTIQIKLIEYVRKFGKELKASDVEIEKGDTEGEWEITTYDDAGKTFFTYNGSEFLFRGTKEW